MTLAFRYILAFGFLVILPMAFVSLVFERQLATTIEDKVSEQSVEIVSQTAELIDSELRTLTIRAAALVNDPAFLEAASRYATGDTPVQTLQSVRDLDSIVSRFFLDSEILGSVFIVPMDSRRFYARQNTSSGTYLDQIPRDRYAPALAHPGQIQLIGDLDGVHQDGDGRPHVTLAVSPSRNLRAPGVSAIVFSARLPSLGRLLSSDASLLDGGALGIVAANGSVIHATAHERFGQALSLLSSIPGQERQEIELRERSTLATTIPIARGRWRLVFLQDGDSLRRLVRRERLPLYVSLVVIVVGFIAYSFVFFRSTVSPLHTLAARMGEVEAGQFDVSVPADGPREIASLATSFNRMVSRIAVLTQETEQTERARADAELEALQYQINPHFVSNTLNSIRLMAHGSGATSIARMTGSLMQIVSDSLRAGEREVTLRRELENLDHYGFIMKVRFGESFSLSFDVPEEHLEYQLLKMLIQPIVENAVVHGVKRNQGHGEIVVSSESTEDAFLLRVADDGGGMDPSVAWSDDGEGSTLVRRDRSIGLRNVDRRIALHYGKPHGVRVDSAPGEGTTVTLHLPALPGEGP